jgi:hypothetical protein
MFAARERHTATRLRSEKSLLAVIMTGHDDDERIQRYADIITEAARWPAR